LYRQLVCNLDESGISEDHVLIILKETAPENRGVQGGKSAADVDPGFNIDV